VFLLFLLAVFVRGIFWRIVFAESEIEYYFFWIHRRFRYHDMQRIRPVSSRNLTARFTFQVEMNSSFLWPPTMLIIP
jgi:hypothetical protein